MLGKKKGEFLQLDTPVFAIEGAAEDADGGHIGAEPLQLAVLEEVEIARDARGSGGQLPGHEVVLRGGGGEARPAIFSLERPDVNQHAAARPANADQTLNGLQLLEFGGEMLDHGDAQHPIESIGSIERDWERRSTA